MMSLSMSLNLGSEDYGHQGWRVTRQRKDAMMSLESRADVYVTRYRNLLRVTGST